MGKCDDSPYEMIEFSSLFEMRNAKLVQAEINTIDPTDNTADITLITPCEVVSELDLTAVEFFYHCEDSKGTLDDLKRGHKAFKEKDAVYVIYIPVNGDTPERFYIIGHVDIRLTKRCALTEYIMIRYRGYVTVYDVAAGVTLDPDSIDPLDINSPPRPGALPRSYDQVFLDWWNYNFEEATPAATIPHTLSDGAAATVESLESRITETLSTGTTSATGTQTRLANDTNNDVITGLGVTDSYSYSISEVSPGGSQYGYCDMSGNFSTVRGWGDTQLGWQIYDAVTHEVKQHKVKATRSEEFSGYLESTWVQDTVFPFAWHPINNPSLEVKRDVTFTIESGHPLSPVANNVSTSLSSSCTISGTSFAYSIYGVGWLNGSQNDHAVAASRTGSYHGYQFHVHFGFTLIGGLGVYAFFPVEVVDIEVPLSDIRAFFTSPGSYGYAIATGFIGANLYLNTGAMEGRTANYNAYSTMKIAANPSVTLFADNPTIDLGEDVSIIECLTAADTSLSNKLNNTVLDLTVKATGPGSSFVWSVDDWENILPSVYKLKTIE